MIEQMKQWLEALEANDKLINGEENCLGLEGAMDGYYSGCFDVDGVNKLTDQAITSLRQAIEEAEKQDDSYCQACDGEMCTAKQGCVALSNPQPTEERNFCPRCGKRTNDIHTCTPPQPKREQDGDCQRCGGKGCVACDARKVTHDVF